MRIVYVLTSLGVGGAERQALALADRMAQRGHTVAILALRPVVAHEWTTELRVIHLDIRKSPVSIAAGCARAGRFLRDFRPDVVHSHSFHANMVARMLKIFVPSARVVSTVHNVYEGRWYRMLAYRLTDALACRTTAVSQAAADRFLRLKTIRPDKCMVIPNEIDLTEFTPSEARRDQVRTEFETGGNFVWIAAGRMVPAKDFPNLLRAFNLVREGFPHSQLWIAGAPGNNILRLLPDGRSGYLGGFVAERSSMEQVRLLGLRRDMPALLDAADAFVQSSAWEGMPLAVGEAMTIEKPVVATNAGGTREIVGDAGTVVPTRDSDALANAMMDLMRRTHEFRQAIGRAARLRIANLFSMDARADDWETLYQILGC